MSFSSKISLRKLFPAIISIAVLLLSSCATYSHSAFTPASNNADQIYTLTQIIFWIALVVFVVVEAMLVYTAIRFAAHKGPASQTEGNTTLEIAWTALPAVVLLIVFIVSAKSLADLSASAVNKQPGSLSGALASESNIQAAGQSLNVRVVGHQWWWEFDYPDFKIITANQLVVPVNTTVFMDIEAVDVIHSFWVPDLGGKTDAVPGHVNKSWFNASKTGDYYGQCAEFCGTQHAGMRIRVTVVSTGDFQTWIKNQQAPAVQSTDQLAQKGQQIFMNGPCIGCHTINGTKAAGKIGPNLTHFDSRDVFAGASLLNTNDQLAAWLADPQALKPGNLMPNLHLSQDQIQALVAFLESLK